MAIVSESSRFGYVTLLEWFKQSGYIEPLTCPIVDASRSSKAFDWWKRNKFQLFYDGGPDIKQFITKNACNLDLLEWLLEKQCLAGADRCGVPYGEWPQLDLLTVAAASLSDFRHNEDVLNAVEWWTARGAVLDANKTALNQAAAAKNVPFLEWMLLRGMDALLEFEQHVIQTKSEPYESWCSFSVRRWWSEANGRAVEARK
ncbi:hypothetical protein DFJ73DRAFT_766119 [Zopfochytrium polystomum]|nr:hypothetical protein DFJ73DRAFT_766119 [Zopfochytrium polystomum]